MSRCRYKVPNAVLPARVVVGVVGTGYFAEGVGDFVFTAAFFAIALVFVEGKAIVAGTNKRTQSVDAFVLAATIVHSALIHV